MNWTIIKKILMNQKGNVGFMGGEGDNPTSTLENTANNTQDISSNSSNTTSTPDVKYAYPQDLDPTYQGNPTLLKFANKDGSFRVGDIMKSYIHAQGMIGSEKIAIPGKNSTEEHWKEVYTKLGVPEKLEDYKIENKVPEGMTPDDVTFEKFKEIAHKVGVLPKQAQEILNFFNGHVSEQNKAYQEKINQEISSGIENLKKEWGNGYQKNIQLADQTLKNFATEEEIAQIKDSGLLMNPALCKLFSKIGKSLLEDSVNPDIKGTIGMSNDEVQNKITSFYAKDHPFMNKSHPQHAHYVSEMMKMLEQLHGNEKVSTF